MEDKNELDIEEIENMIFESHKPIVKEIKYKPSHEDKIQDLLEKIIFEGMQEEEMTKNSKRR